MDTATHFHKASAWRKSFTKLKVSPKYYGPNVCIVRPSKRSEEISKDNTLLISPVEQEEPISSEIKVQQFLNNLNTHSEDFLNTGYENPEVFDLDISVSQDKLIPSRSPKVSSYRHKSPFKAARKTLKGIVKKDTEINYTHLEENLTSDSTGCFPSCLKNKDIFDNCSNLLRMAKLSASTNNLLASSLYYSQTDLDTAVSHPSIMLQISSKSTGKNKHTKRNSDKMYQAYIGQLKLSVDSDKRELKITIAEAKDLDCCGLSTMNDSKSFGYFIQVHLAGKKPLAKPKTQQSRIIKDSHYPEFQEEFKLTLKKKDYKKRLFVSVYHTENSAKEATTHTTRVGCFSFSVENLVKKRTVVNGWFYLLTESLGQFKHMQVDNDQQESQILPNCIPRTRKNSEGSSSIVSTVPSESSGYNGSTDDSLVESSDDEDDYDELYDSLKKLNFSSHMENIQITLVKKQNMPGYGFTLVDNLPVMVSQVKAGSSADHAGLQAGDYIVKVNGEPVHDMCASTLGKIIRHHSRYVVLGVLRSVDSDSDDDSCFEKDF